MNTIIAKWSVVVPPRCLSSLYCEHINQTTATPEQHNRNPNKQSNKQTKKTKQTIKSQKTATFVRSLHYFPVTTISFFLFSPRTPHPSCPPKRLLAPRTSLRPTRSRGCANEGRVVAVFFFARGRASCFISCLCYCVYLLEVLNACIFVLQQMNVVLQRGRGDMTTTARLKDEVTNFEMGATTQPSVIR